MKIQEDHSIRDLTPDEEAEYRACDPPEEEIYEEQAAKAEAYDILMGVIE